MKIRNIVASFAMVFAFAFVAKADSVVFSDNFNTNLGQSAIASGAIDSSTTGTFYSTGTSGNIDVVGPNYFSNLCDTGAESGSCVDLDGTPGPGQITSSAITLGPGNYTLSYDIYGTERGPSATTTVSFGPYCDQTYTLASSAEDVITCSFTVTSPITTEIVFTSDDAIGDDEGTLIDNVVVTNTPEPASIALLAIGLLPLMWFVRKQRLA